MEDPTPRNVEDILLRSITFGNNSATIYFDYQPVGLIYENGKWLVFIE